MNNGLILTMGLSPEPLIFSIKELQAKYVVFIGTDDSFNKSIDITVEQSRLLPSQYKKFEIPDNPSKLSFLCEKFQEAKEWLQRKNVQNIYADPTGGRKWMSAGATMVASFLGLPMLYIDAKYKDGKIVLETMKSVQMGNAYDQTGFILAAKGRDAFNKMDFKGAAYQFNNINPTNANKIKLYNGLTSLCFSLARWDRFEHYDGNISQDINKAILDIEISLNPNFKRVELDEFLNKLKTFSHYISSFESISKLNVQFIADIFLNAQRCIKRGRFDDAIARQYRTLEAISQFILEDDFKFDTSNPDYKILNDEQRDNFKTVCIDQILPSKIDLKLGFWLLKVLNHPIKDLVFKGKKTYKDFVLEGVLSNRNASILAHGFKPIKEQQVEKFNKSLDEILSSVFNEGYSNAKERLSVPNMPTFGF